MSGFKGFSGVIKCIFFNFEGVNWVSKSVALHPLGRLCCNLSLCKRKLMKVKEMFRNPKTTNKSATVHLQEKKIKMLTFKFRN